MADRTPTATSRLRLRITAAITAVALTLAWASLAWPDLVLSFREPLHRRALLVGGLCLGGGALLRPFARGVRKGLGAGPPWAFLLLASAASAALSLWLFLGPMKGLLLSRDACVYLLQAKALAHLRFGVPVSPPRLAFSAHFLFEGADGMLHGVFAPGYPLFLAPFTVLYLPWLPGAFTAVLLTLAQVALARALDRDPWTTRLALLLALPSFARAVETADLLSHAFVAALCAFAFALALRLPERPKPSRAVALGVCVGWVFAARMLDGFVLGGAVALILLAHLARRALAWRAVALAFACALPFAAFVAAQQKVATGSFRMPTSVAYVRHADFPPTCLHLGFGRDVGCVVEHGPERAAFGDDGYTPRDALRLVRERTSVLGADLFGLGAITLVAFAGLALAPDAGALAAGGFALVFTLAYGLFYYGNAPVFGARHVFPLGPFLWALVARAIAHLPRRASGWFDGPHVQGAALAALVGMMAVALPPRWASGLAFIHRIQGPRQDVRALIARDHVDHAIVLTPDIHAYLSEVDPWADGDHRVFALDDGAGNLDLRRFHPQMPVFESVGDGRLLAIHTPTPGPGIRVEFERAWPAFVRPHGLGAAVVDTRSCCQIASSGDEILHLFAASPGSSVEVPFDVARAGRYRLHVEGFVYNDYGQWALAIDGVPLPPWDGYAAQRARAQGRPTAPRFLAAGPHTFTARSVGKNPLSRGYLAAFDDLVGEWVR